METSYKLQFTYIAAAARAIENIACSYNENEPMNDTINRAEKIHSLARELIADIPLNRRA
jgi:hypothetical protein